jgi:glycosyltransferase involved in cell wall biosynthesis
MEHFVIRLAGALRARGHEATVVAITHGPLFELARASGVPTTVLRGETRAQRVSHAAAHFAVARPSVVHCHNPTSLHYAALAKVAGLSRLVFTDHAQTKGIIRAGSSLEWHLVDAYASVSEETAGHAADIGYHGLPEVVRNGIDPTPARRPRAEVRAELGLDDRPVGINVASFFSVKAQDVLVRAAASLKARGVPLAMVYVGEGSERQRVTALSAELGLGPADHRFLGFRTDVADLLAAADFFVLPSRAEGLPISLLEAMSHHLPVVCTRVGGNPELVTDGVHGALVPAGDPEALAAAMERLALDPDLRRRQGEAGAARVHDEFSFDRTTDHYEAIYHRVLARRSTWPPPWSRA